MYCKHCGNEIDDNSKCCKYFGKGLDTHTLAINPSKFSFNAISYSVVTFVFTMILFFPLWLLIISTQDVPVKTVSYPQFEIHNVTRGSHDCTFIGDELVSFAKPSDAGANGNAYYINISDWRLDKQIFVNFIEPSTNRELEMKSCDYRYDKLLVGNGRAIKYGESSYTEQGAKLYVFYDAADWRDSEESEITFNNCGNYDVIDVSDLGYKIYGFWGQFDDCVHVSCNLLNDVYLIQLGRGTNNFGEGNYQSANENRYNGSYKTIGHWHQNDYFGDWAAHGGQFYRGYLYLAINNYDVCEIYKCIFGEDGRLTFDKMSFHVNSHTVTDKLLFAYIDGVCIKDGLLYAQPLIKNGSYENVNDVIVAEIDSNPNN